MKPEMLVILAIFVSFCLAEIVFTQFFSKSEQKKGDGIVELFSTLALVGFTQPFVLASAGIIASKLIPQHAGALSGLNIFAAIGLLLIFDDMLQYWWHRASHSWAWLYKLHRPHHNAQYMSIRIVYRNNFFYYLFMPALWGSGLMVYLGLGWVYAGYIVVKMLVIYGAHSDITWDKPLLARPKLAPLMWVVQRTISTPATHFAHHGRHKDDGVTHYKGNYGNLLFFWDVIFGTAKISQTYPPLYGVEDLPDTSIGEQLIWPIIRVK
ncbi:MAG: sterol desaturase family protein [Robiginitomaculum sp.]